MDARQRKTRARLAETVLALASDRPIASVTVSEIATAAEVHRSTFYEHAASPVDLLERVLSAELDDLRERFLVGVTPDTAASAVQNVTDAVLEHVEQHSAIYSRGLGEQSGSASLHAMLSSHFRGSVELLLEQRTVDVPVASLLGRDAAAAYIADGTVGAVRSWLDSPEPRDRAEFLALFAFFVPAWWPGAMRAGAVS